MDNFEKQQTIEAIKTVIKARWLYVLLILLQALFIKTITLNKVVPLPSLPLIFLLFIAIFILNFGYWIYFRRPFERVKVFQLKIIKFSQFIIDQLSISAILYFSGTVNKMLILAYFVPLVFAASLYRRKGVIFAAVSGILLFSFLVILEYLGIIKPGTPEETTFARFVTGDKVWLRGELIGFTFYYFCGAVAAIYMADLFRKREEELKIKKDELTGKTEILTTQTQELTKTRDWLHDALIKSDTARLEIKKTKDELQKTNVELQAKINELEKYGEVTTGRELKMIELKEKIRLLEEKIAELYKK
ncbi:MAG: hypothetical protein A2Y98_01500 [Candidatus Portnoybacteria bacterium RBG_19FT_COMBO_36_7]|uniref:Uncharacterized protein n=1 Tax=Candidatus Portnoybacteria bacterium RBG_19FT_COMBO_36_7 TaxID=1801992 RepID=A0A1G2F7I2_9BACT|nr:MAG: hypothetical protein A2Y98_01500 [Candidatus Portnoybacteria bacterium RBG_19FT_COMBO_36_7]